MLGVVVSSNDYIWLIYIGNIYIYGFHEWLIMVNGLLNGLPQMGVPLGRWFLLVEKPMKMDHDMGHRYSRKPPFCSFE